MDLKRHSIFWQVSLSNGETFYENKGDYKTIPGELSPWNRLQKYIADNKLLITSLSLYTQDGRTFNLPSAGRSPKFRPFQVAEKPLDYNYAHYIAREHDIVDNEVQKTEVSEWFTVIEAIYPEYRLQVWVDEQNPKNSWVLVVKI